MTEETGALTLLNRGSNGRSGSLLGRRRMSSGRVRLLLLAVGRTSRLSGSSRTSRSAARRGRGRSGTTALTRHVG